MKQTRKWLALALAGALSLSLLAGCGDNAAESSAAPSPEASPEAAEGAASGALSIAEQGIFSAGGTVISSGGTFD
ncbi:MAG TPA: alpha/beta hydrolase, partial [Firmicutes bacterium]|nr:alpha/beta hydrolase [Bacillota bacterium]